MPLAGPPLASPVDLNRILEQGLAGDPDATALISLETSWTWQELEDDSGRLAGNLLDLGLKPGDRAATLMHNRCGVIVFYLACIKAGLVATPLAYRSRPEDIDEVLAVSGASILLANRERAADIAASRQASKLPFGIIAFGQGALSGTSFDSLLEKEPETAIFPPRLANSLAAIFFTRDAAGHIDGITHSIGSLGWNSASLAAGFGLTPEDVVLASGSIAHIAGLTQSLAALTSGARVAIARNNDPDEILPLLRAEQPTVAYLLPAVLYRLIRDHDAVAKDFASIRLLTCGGDKAPLALRRRFEETTGQLLREHYALTETGPVTLNAGPQARAAGSIGTLLPGVEAEIRDPAGIALPPDSVGRLWLKSGSLSPGYWQSDEAFTPLGLEGWIDSGDLMTFDASGCLWHAGPKSNLVVHDNPNIVPDEIEKVLMQFPGVAAAGVVGVRDLARGEKVQAYVALEPDTEPPTEQDLIAFTRSHIGFKAPEQIVFLDSLPRGQEGSSDRTYLKALAECALLDDDAVQQQLTEAHALGSTS
ncbi:MAG: acyl--CoA ligase [Rhodospirillales bacterium]|nr:acyl--CoA ligase [Rhodospirillales bacterium]